MNLNPSYVPILKWKKGEQGALKELSTTIKNGIIPLIEITPDFNESKLLSTIKSWENRPLYFDVLPECYEDDNEIYFRILGKLNHDYTIPVLSLADDMDIMQKANNLSNLGFALRIISADAEYVENILEQITQNFNPSYIDLILDIKHIDAENYNEKYIVLKSILLDIPNINDYRNIIVATSSFPNTLTSVERYELATIERLDWSFWKKCINKLNKKFNINLIYSDYTIDTPNYVAYIPGMSPLFKIRYTSDDDFIILKGQTIKKGGLDSDSVSDLCNTLTTSSYFKGNDFSWGDNYIYEHSNNSAKSYGNLTTWVKVGTNHHITFVINQLSNLS
ncbi:hypothetical protein EXM30_11150 [Clostridium botulinum]|uniref:beta family protein n=1 Tax=Clostridium botulinum TaxID=1491 RepID=UPI0007E19140|nr:beta family protein [Clostridium botulinum]KEI83389.1 hypothetical protein N487_00310 [Clostridium botulinum B2 331]NFA91038.1 hypothetical protein [Clostridium botulinum]NFB21228.1 hypothetical protein [Clostridium botulinum]NFT58437.1 hypothetical protein [Clostridium botulinum]